MLRDGLPKLMETLHVFTVSENIRRHIALLQCCDISFHTFGPERAVSGHAYQWFLHINSYLQTGLSYNRVRLYQKDLGSYID